MSKPDWEAIETAYRAGVMSLREIASQHGISEGAISKRAKRGSVPLCAAEGILNKWLINALTFSFEVSSH